MFNNPMKLDRNRLSDAVRIALSLGAVAAVDASAYAQDQSASQDQNNKQTQALETIIVTGSHIRRVDLETSNPVVTISSKQIEATGKLTIGEIIQNLSVVTGGLQNSNVNNGGGSGQTLVGLRGIGASRTLVLVDGQRLITFARDTGTTPGADLNAIPAAAVDRIEVLTDGASAIYGSDAIGGVINVILKSNYQGAEFSSNYGISDKDDGERRGGSFIFGQTTDKGSILAGIEYNRYDQVLQGNRKFSHDALSLSSTAHGGTTVSVGGSTYAARDYIVAPASVANCGAGGALSLNSSAANASNGATSLSDYHCFTQDDKYNYAAVNLLLTPQERTNLFLKGIYKLTDNIDFSATLLHQKTTSDFQLAPTPFGTGTGISISKDSYYNPFGVDFTPSNGNQYKARLFPTGDRGTRFATTTDQGNFAFNGNLNVLGQDWIWDVGYDFGHIARVRTVLGVPNSAALEQGLGPSFLNAQGVVQCGTAASPISLDTCTPWDPFNLYSANSQKVIAENSAPALISNYAISRYWHADASGGVFDLPAGTVQLATGLDYSKQYVASVVPGELVTEPYPPFACPLGSLCSAAVQGGFNVKEAYAELYVPILKDLPFARSLNVTLGDRYSKYSDFGSTNNFKAGIEWRPIDDLLLRGTATSVFRAPAVVQIFGSPTTSAPFLSSDPCDGYRGAPAGSGPAMACVNVPTDGSFKDGNVSSHSQLNAVVAGSKFFGINLKPESGKTFDFGAVYSPSYVPGLSLTADLWRLYLNDTITIVSPQTSLDLCYNGVSYWCQFVNQRLTGSSAGQPGFWELPTANLGRLDVKGLDVSANYKLPQFSFGQVTLGMNATYLSQYKLNTAPGEPGSLVLNAAGEMGTYGSALGSTCVAQGALCFFPRVRGNTTLAWSLGPVDAQLTTRYISAFRAGSPDLSQYSTVVAGIPGYSIRYGATVYNDLTAGYNIESLNTRIDLGVDNIANKQPPLLYANNTLGANTDPSDFDVLGRYYWARITVKF